LCIPGTKPVKRRYNGNRNEDTKGRVTKIRNEEQGRYKGNSNEDTEGGARKIQKKSNEDTKGKVTKIRREQ
jgi:hypothetical protein